MERELTRVLLIEDNLGDAKFIHEMINDARNFHFKLDHAFRLSSGLEFIQKNKYDVILLDLGLPDSFGLETLQEVHSAAEPTPIVIMTGLDDEELGIKAVQLGAQDYIVKLQIDSNLLIRSIRYAIERKKNSQKLQISETNLAEAQKLAHLGNYEISLSGDWATGSEEAYRILGRDPSEKMSSMDEYVTKIVHPDDREMAKCLTEEVVNEKHPVEFDFRALMPNGEIKYIHNIIRPVFNESGEVISLFGIIMDITEQKQSQQALVDSEELSRVMFEQAAIGITLASFDGTLFRVNDKFCEIVGYSRDELLKMKFHEITHPDDLSRDLECLQQILDKEINAYSLEKRYLKKDGSFVWVNLTISAIYTSSGELKYYLGVVEDITERKWAMEQNERYVEELRKNRDLLEENARELSVLNQKLNESNINKDKFFSILAHDLRSPFSALLGFSEFLSNHLEELSRDEIKEFSQRINKSLNNLFKLIENLLQWSRIQTGRIDYSPAAFDVHLLAAESIEIYHVNAAQKKIEIINEIPKDVFVFADKDMIDSVIGNILSNGIKFTPPGGKITLRAVEKDDFINISVADTGVGISTENLDRLFKIEQTLSTEGTEKEKGTGLGLILCKEFVEINNGKISVNSQIGKGSEFIVSLPKAI